MNDVPSNNSGYTNVIKGIENGTMNLELVLSNPENYPENQIHRKLFDDNGGSIGRDPKCDLVLHCDEKTISRIHAQIIYQDDKFLVCDLSANGVFVNSAEEPIGHGATSPLHNGDILRVGQFEFRATISGTSLAVTKRAPLLEKISAHAPSTPALVSPANVAPVNTKPNGVIPQKVKVALGTPTDSFTPPNVFIPDNWDGDLSLEAAPKTSADKKSQQHKLHLVDHETKLISELLKGLEMSDHFMAEQITPETMALIGRTLRIAINGAMTNREWLQKTKAELCLDVTTAERSAKPDALVDSDKKATFIKGHLEAGVLGHIKTTKMFLNTLLDHHHKFQNALPDSFAESHKEAIEDHNDIYHVIEDTENKLAEVLSPDEIETAFDYQQRIDGRNQSSIKQLSSKLTQNSSKWDFYQKNWKRFLQNAVILAHKNFESVALLKQVTRIKNKKNARY